MYRPGQILFAIGIVGFGIQCLISSGFVPGLQPMPSWMPGGVILANLTGVFLVATGVGVLLEKTGRLAALALALVFLLWVVLLHAPKLAADPSDGGAWSRAFMTLAIGGASLVLAGLAATPRTLGKRWDRFAGRGITLGRWCYGISLPVFGVVHYIYHDFIAGMIPAWMPGRPYWPYLTGAANFAAGVAILINVKPRLAATMLALMFGSWVMMLHIPGVAARVQDANEWNALFVALALCGGALIVAASFAGEASVKPAEARA